MALRHCDVDMQVIDSTLCEKDGVVLDVLTFRCPVCGAQVKQEYPRKAEAAPAGQSRGLPQP